MTGTDRSRFPETMTGQHAGAELLPGTVLSGRFEIVRMLGIGGMGVVYKGSADDAALNAGVLRYRAHPAALARFAQDTDPTGRIPVPVLTVKGVNDPTAFVELDSVFKATMDRAGTSGHLVQTFTQHSGHSYLSHPTYPTLMAALLRWVNDGTQPTPASIARQCPALEARFGKGCAFLPDYRPAALNTRVPDRERP